MNETPQPVVTTPAPSPARSPTPSPATTRGGSLRAWHLVVLIALLAALALWQVRTVQQLHEVRTEQASRMAQWHEAIGVSSRELGEARKKLDALEEELGRVKGQRADLEQLVQEITRGRDEALLIEVERLIVAAANELQLSANVPAAIVTLQVADSRLARADRAPLVALRRTLARDLERLRALPVLDITGIALRLDQIAAGVETWPLLADPATPLAPKEESRPTQSPAKSASQPETDAPADLWAKARAWLHDQFGDVVRIREVATPESVLLSGNQQQLVRQQLRLRLFDARQALVVRNDKLYRADLQETRVLLLRYFDLKQPGAAAALVQLDKLATTALSVEIQGAGLQDALAAVRAARLPAVRQP